MVKRINRLGLRFAAAVLAFVMTFSCAWAAPVIYGYREGLAQASENGLWGYANPLGEIVIPIRYQSILDFNLGTALVRTGNKMGLIRQDGTYLLDPEYDTLENLGYGLYLAQRGDFWGVMSIVSFPDSGGGETRLFLPFEYSAARTDNIMGLDVLVLTGESEEKVVPLTRLPSIMEEKGVPSARFPLVKGKLPSFSDVSPRQWYAVWVDLAYNLGLMQGVGDGAFAPGQTLTVAEVLRLAAVLESRSQKDNFHLQPVSGTPWYRSSVTYCEASGIIQPGQFDSYQRPITRAEMAQVFASTTQGRSLSQINSMSKVKAQIPDVNPEDFGADAIYALYAKGILRGTDGGLTFRPDSSLTRAEAAAIVSRMARPEQRIKLWPAVSMAVWLNPAMNGAEILPEGTAVEAGDGSGAQ